MCAVLYHIFLVEHPEEWSKLTRAKLTSLYTQ